jgi:hypothetical protein
LVGAAGGAIGAGLVTLWLGKGAAEAERKQERTEDALVELVRIMEHEQWDLINAYSDHYDQWVNQVGDPGRFAFGSGGDVSAGAAIQVLRELIASIRRMRLYITRIDHADVREAYRRYMAAGVKAMVMAGIPKQAPLPEVDAFRDSAFPLRCARHHRGVLQRHWNRARLAAGRPDLHFHDLRHTGNTWAAATGASTKELMARMGHSSARAALIYQHATADRDRVIADALAEMQPLAEVKPIRRSPS